MTKSVWENLQNVGLLPSVRLDAAQDVLPLVDALTRAGAPCAEFTFNAAAREAFTLLAAQKPEFLAGARVGARSEAAAALEAGATFVTGETSSAEESVRAEDLPGGRVEIPAELVKQKNWAEITRLVNGAFLKLLDFNLRHVGINSKNEAESDATCSSFERIFGLPKEDRGGAYFAGDIIEVMKKPFYGAHGHIAISTAHADLAARYLQTRGVKLNWDSAGYNPDGRLRVVYLQDEIGGFAVHILQK